MKLNNHIALVTGGASGLGAQTARRLAEQGARVAILDLNANAAKVLASQLDGVAVTADVSDEQSASQALQQVIEQLGTPRILVNCAGIGTAGRVVGREGPMPLNNFNRVVQINLVGTFNMIRLAAARMSELEPLEDDERGVIVCTASIAAYDGQIGQAAYSASKGGIVSMTLPIARELSRFGIRINTIAPGIFHTPLLDTLPLEAQQSLAAGIPFPSRLGKPEEFAAMVETCITNNYLNGETIRIDGAVRLAPK
jgi:NAD(P)-dependent dehydrogenase (short-subunit alcohol dehydrogenase family)